MGFRPHPSMAETDAQSPRCWGTCARCGFVGNLIKFRDQADWRGLQIMSLHLLVCSPCYDTPQRQLGTIVLPPDPVGVLNARPEPYPMDENWIFLWENLGYPVYLEGSQQAAITLETSIYSNDGDWPWPP